MRDSVLPVMAVMTVVAGAVGLHLGESAIAQIDPTYFQGPLMPARDVSAHSRPQAAAGFAQASGWEEGNQALAQDSLLLVRQTQVVSPAVPAFGYSDAPAAPRWAGASEAADEVRIERSLESARVQRYLHYPVSADRVEIIETVEVTLPPEPLAPEPRAEETPAGL